LLDDREAGFDADVPARIPSSIIINAAIKSVRIPKQEREKERESPTEMIDEWEKGVLGSGCEGGSPVPC